MPQTSTTDVNGFLADVHAAVGRALERWCEWISREIESPVSDAMVYSLSAPGKRLRPALALGAYDGLGGTGDASELAAALEIVHTYSLVHDDLPCMDDDDMRRGRPTTHRRFGPTIAMEAGFRLVPLSAKVLASGARRLGLGVATLEAMARELYGAAGATGMIGGQVLDLEAEDSDVSLDRLTNIHRMKTGALITASAVIGAMAAGAPAQALDAVRGYGEDVGLAFQIVDDVLDATGTSQELGKTAGKDADQHKASFASLLGVEEARRRAAEHVDLAIARLGGAGIDSPVLVELARMMVERKS